VSEGDHRGSVVALREVRNCLESLGEMLWLAPNGIDLAAMPDDVLLAETEPAEQNGSRDLRTGLGGKKWESHRGVDRRRVEPYRGCAERYELSTCILM
jgi:hypothetical protein